MNEAYIFLWITWIFWMIVTFFLPKTIIRTALASWILIIIITSTILISFQNHLIISAAFFALILGGIVIISLQKHWFFNLIKILIVLFTHVALLLMMKVSPVIVVLPESFMVVLLHSLLVLILSNQFFKQLTIIILGGCLGEFVYGIILNNLYMFYIVGNFLFLSRLMIVIFLLMIIQAFKKLRRSLLLHPNAIGHEYFNDASLFNLKSQQQ